jgi:lysophospholipase L1-like esterase
MAQRPRIRRLLFYSLVTLVIVAGLVEFAARRMAPEPMRYAPDEKFWILGEHTNLFGQYDDAVLFRIQNYTATQRKKLWPKRLVCLGSSSTYGAGLADRTQAFPGVLDRLLPEVEVINAGFGGYNAYQLSIYLEEVLLRLNPDVVVFYYGGNEGYGASAKTFYPRAKQIVAAMRARGITERNELENAVRHGTASAAALWFFGQLDRSKAFLWWRDRVVSARIVGGMIDNPLTPNDPRLETKPTATEILATMAELTRQAGGTMVLVPELSSELRIAAPFVWEPMQRLCGADEALCVNPLAAPPGLDSPEQFIDTSHLTVEGHERLAETILPIVKKALGQVEAE